MTDNTSTEVPKTWHDATRQWLFQQGTSTVLLVLILAALYYTGSSLIPWHMQMIQAGYDRNARDLKDATTPIANSVDKLAERVDRLIDREYRREPDK